MYILIFPQSIHTAVYKTSLTLQPLFRCTGYHDMSAEFAGTRKGCEQIPCKMNQSCLEQSVPPLFKAWISGKESRSDGTNACYLQCLVLTDHAVQRSSAHSYSGIQFACQVLSTNRRARWKLYMGTWPRAGPRPKHQTSPKDRVFCRLCKRYRFCMQLSASLQIDKHGNAALRDVELLDGHRGG